MTDMLQKAENVAKNVANENSQDLTEQWKRGEFIICNAGKCQYYYVQNEEQKEVIKTEYCLFDDNTPNWQILAPVPSFEKWKAKLEENAQLKEQINKYYLDAINRGTANAVKAVKEFGMPERIKELVEQNAQLKEDYKRMGKLLRKMEESDNAREKFQDEQNAQLKELLKECSPYVSRSATSRMIKNSVGFKKDMKLLTKIDEVLK